jgi:hypothetical protein
MKLKRLGLWGLNVQFLPSPLFFTWILGPSNPWPLFSYLTLHVQSFSFWPLAPAFHGRSIFSLLAPDSWLLTSIFHWTLSVHLLTLPFRPNPSFKTQNSKLPLSPSLESLAPRPLESLFSLDVGRWALNVQSLPFPPRSPFPAHQLTSSSAYQLLFPLIPQIHPIYSLSRKAKSLF